MLTHKIWWALQSHDQAEFSLQQQHHCIAASHCSRGGNGISVQHLEWSPISPPWQAGWTPLHAAVNAGHMLAARVLLVEGANIACVTNVGWRSPCLAAECDA